MQSFCSKYILFSHVRFSISFFCHDFFGVKGSGPDYFVIIFNQETTGFLLEPGFQRLLTNYAPADNSRMFTK